MNNPYMGNPTKALPFKEGYEKGIEFLELTAETQFKAGIKEVVEWLSSKVDTNFPDNLIVGISVTEWQSKLKEWGI
jgi:hypothetical protein